MLRIHAVLITLSLALCAALSHSASEIETAPLRLPSLGETSAGLLSPSEEYELGQVILRIYRGGLPTSKDPFVETYLAGLIQRIVTFSELQDKRIELLVLESPALNAFAAPGGIVGVNTGTFLVSKTEQQLASIIAHELAHLSQRHYARRVQNNSQNATVGLAAILASLVIAASGNSDVALAAIPSIQAASIQAQLKFSRDMEREADRIGIHNMVNAGFDPYAMSEMFELMSRSSRYRNKVPEFLMSHPVTESRISDSFSRANRFPPRQFPLNPEFQLVRARILVDNETNPGVSIKRFSDEVESHHTMSAMTAHYGLVLSYIAAEQPKQARTALSKLKTIVNHPIFLAVAEADIQVLEKDYEGAVKTLSSQLKSFPTNHPLNVRLAEIYMLAGQYAACEKLLKQHVIRQPQNDYVWYLLAEVHGLAGHILEVHKARAEFFILNGVFDKAEIQLRNALRLVDPKDFQAKAKIEQRLLDVKKLQSQKL